MSVKVKVKKLNEKAIIPFKKIDSDFCYDVVATSREEIAPHVFRYGIGLAFAMQRPDWCYPDEFCISIDMRPRSSVWEHGLVLANCEGTVDELYRGEVKAVFYHVLPDMPLYEVGERIGQIKFGVTWRMDFEETDELDETVRGAGGFGSTGK